jgi:hypothetical protein
MYRAAPIQARSYREVRREIAGQTSDQLVRINPHPSRSLVLGDEWRRPGDEVSDARLGHAGSKPTERTVDRQIERVGRSKYIQIAQPDGDAAALDRYPPLPPREKLFATRGSQAI